MSMSESEYTPPPPPPPQSNGKANPAVLFIIVIFAVVFFISGLLHLLARFITKHRSSSSSSSSLSDHNPDISNSETFQRQLQQLFNLHDSGLDQSFIDALPLFQYKEIKGLDEPFDCAVCLSRFLEDDKLRLLPLCSHAFHIDCIDTWLLSNSTCPLCRGSLYTPGLPIQNPVFESDDWSEEDCGSNIGLPNNVESNEVEIAGEKKMVLPVKLGKFNSSNRVEAEVETSSSNLDARRCFSMGSYQYVVAESELQVALSSSSSNRGRVIDGDLKGKKINMKSKNDSFSVSKIWLWSSNKGKFPGSSPNITDIVDHAGVDMRFPWNNVD